MSDIDLSRDALERNICTPIINYVADGRHMTEKQLAGIIDTVRALASQLSARDTECREAVMQSLASMGQAQEAYEALVRAEARIATLPEALKEGRRAIGDHFAPHDCYATGPLTGDTFRDLVQCPACSFIAEYDAALTPTTDKEPKT